MFSVAPRSNAGYSLHMISSINDSVCKASDLLDLKSYLHVQKSHAREENKNYLMLGRKKLHVKIMFDHAK